MKKLLRLLSQILGETLVGILRVYQWVVSPLLGANCRYMPTCSQYAVEALRTHSLFKALGFIIKRVSSCHRWSTRNPYDPVP